MIADKLETQGKITDATQSFILNLQVQSCSAETLSWYSYIFRQFADWASKRGLLSVEELTPDLLREYFVYAEKEHFNRQKKQVGLSQGTRAGHFRALRSWLNYLVREEWIEKSPLESVKAIKQPREKISPFTKEQIQQLLDAARRKDFVSQRNYTLIHLLFDTGLRINEALSLEEKNLHLLQQRINVLGKGNKERSVPFGKMTLKLLIKYLDRLKRRKRYTERIFINRYGLPVGDRHFSRSLEVYAKRAGITGVRVSPHTLRHTFAVNYLLAGGDVFSLQEILGHESVETTMVYVKFTEETLRQRHQLFSPGDRLARGSLG